MISGLAQTLSNHRWLHRRVLWWRILFGLAAGALLAAAWQLSTTSTGVEQESSFYRYWIASLFEKSHAAPEVYAIDTASEDNDSSKASPDHPTLPPDAERVAAVKQAEGSKLVELISLIETSHPAVIGLILNNKQTAEKLPKELMHFKNNLVIGINGLESQGKSSLALATINFPGEPAQLTYKMPSPLQQRLNVSADSSGGDYPPFAHELVNLFDKANGLPPNSYVDKQPGRYLTVNLAHQIQYEHLPIPSQTLGKFTNKVVLIANSRKIPLVAVPTRIITQMELQAQTIASLIHQDAYVDVRYRSFELWMLPAGLVLCTIFSVLKPIPRIIAWSLSWALVVAGCQYFFMCQHVITIFGSIMLLVHCCYLCGTIIFLETETVERKRALALAIQERSENERKRIARELHDDVLPNLSRIMRLIDRQQDADQSSGEEMREKLENVVDSTRRIINDLHPAILENLGLIQALEHLVMKFNAESQLVASFENKTGKGDFDFSPSTKLSIYRMVQEALNNVEKHAEGKKVEVVIAFSDGDLTFTIADDGKGFKPKGRPDSAGLLNIVQRAELIGANVVWKPNEKLARGTSMIIKLKISGEILPP